jgi:hypothetical protein
MSPYPKPLHFVLLIMCLLSSIGAAFPAGKTPDCLEFTFSLPLTGGNEFAREVFAEVSLPAGRSLVIPAFLSRMDGLWTVRVRNEGTGTYALKGLHERKAGKENVLAYKSLSPERIDVRTQADKKGFIRIDPKNPRRFAFADGEPFFPLGSNCAWAPGGDFQKIFEAFEKNHLNWGRVWMCHWGNTNMEWLSSSDSPAPTPGTYDLSTADRWDKIIEDASAHGVYFQLVLQHHGQLSTEVNSNWVDNPWNSANGGFLAKPGDFFRSERARALVRQKLRTCVARWSYSTAIMAWELFNEVMFTDAVRVERDEASVIRWHKEMSDYLRSIDPYHHLITTSTDEVDSPIYDSLDFIQPHRYSLDMISNVIGFDAAPPADKPVFYGEIGDDHMLASSSDKQKGFTLDASTWASLCGGTLLPAQQWYHDRLIPTGRIASIGSAALFARFAGLDHRDGLVPFQAEVICAAKIPQRLSAAFFWHKRKPTTVPIGEGNGFDRSYADIPHFLVGTPQQVADGYADRVTFDFRRGVETKGTVHFTECGPKGALVKLLLDGLPLAEQQWKASSPGSDAPSLPPADVKVTVPPGRHQLSIVNTGEDTVRFGFLELDKQMDLLACFGRRSANFAVFFVWHRTAVFTQGAEPVKGVVKLMDTPAGKWRVTWWDVARQSPGPAIDIVQKETGLLEIETPDITRFAAGTLERLP